MGEETFDYVIVGAGSAGCVLASRLSEDGARVALLEAGPPDRHPMIHVPAGIMSLITNPAVNWNYHSEPEEGTAGRAIHWPRGRVIGGSHSINGMLYVRGHAADFDGWAQMGCRGWSYSEVLPYFRRSESYDGGEDDLRGRDGPMPVNDYKTVLPLTHGFVEAARQAGHPLRADYNDGGQSGVAYSQMTRGHRLRASTARTFLAPARKRPNLRVFTEALATRLRFDGRRCVGVELSQAGRPRVLQARREVILSAGAVNSPHLLQISGIGPAAHLADIGVPVLHDLPGVGANLSDHYVLRVVHRVRDTITMNELSRGWRRLREVARFALFADGALLFGATSAMVFCDSREGVVSPDLQLLFMPASITPGRMAMDEHPGLSVAVCPVRPASRGSVMAVSADPTQAPLIRPNYLSDPDDLRVLLAGIRTTREILAAPALARYSECELLPGPERQSDEELAQAAREQGTTLYHPVGTCKMGSDPMAVVDPDLKVHDLEGLRVADASVMPILSSGNTNAPTIMIAEKAADMIRSAA